MRTQIYGSEFWNDLMYQLDENSPKKGTEGSKKVFTRELNQFRYILWLPFRSCLLFEMKRDGTRLLLFV